MLAVVPLVALVMLAILAYREGRGGVRRAVLAATVLWGTFLVATTELLSLFDGIGWGSLLTVWGALILALGYLLLFAPGWDRYPKFEGSADWPALLIVPVLMIVVLAICLLVAGLVGAPNNYDSMTYHMMRVAHWLQNGGVKFYPTHIQRQLAMGPMAEYGILHFQVLAGGSDRCANLVQWLAYVVGIVGVSRIAKQIGAGPGGQVAAAAVAASIPMAVLQASSTQNDLVNAVWLIALTSFGLDLRDWTDPRDPPTAAAKARPAGRLTSLRATAALAGAALGLALLTKGTAYPLALPILAWVGWGTARRLGRKAIVPATLAAAIALALNAGFYARNAALYGSPLGPGTEQDATRFKYTNDVYTPGALFSNLVRNLALHLTAPTREPHAPDARAAGPLNAAVADAAVALHRWLNIDPDDPRTTWTDTRFMVWGEGWSNENFAPAPLHLLLLIACVATLLVARKRTPGALPLAGCLVAGFVLFCATLKWQQWHVRQHLPLLMLGGAVAGAVLGQVWNRFVGAALVLGLLVLAAFPMVYNAGHPWEGPASIFDRPRVEQYFAWCPGHYQVYQATAQAARQVHTPSVGVECGMNDPVYPLWAVLRASDPAARLESWTVTNPSAAYAGRAPYAGFKPGLVLTLGEGGRVNLRQGP